MSLNNLFGKNISSKNIFERTFFDFLDIFALVNNIFYFLFYAEITLDFAKFFLDFSKMILCFRKIKSRFSRAKSRFILLKSRVNSVFARG